MSAAKFELRRSTRIRSLVRSGPFNTSRSMRCGSPEGGAVAQPKACSANRQNRMKPKNAGGLHNRVWGAEYLLNTVLTLIFLFMNNVREYIFHRLCQIENRLLTVTHKR